MAIGWGDLAAYVGSDDQDALERALATADALVDNYINTSIGGVPEEVRDEAALKVASELFHAKNAPNGISQFAAFDGAPVRVARDPMVAAYPLLNRFLVTGI